MSKSHVSEKFFRVIVKTNPQAQKVLFYLTSYKVPWWVYIIPILRFRNRGYEVVVYDFADTIIESDDPDTLPRAVQVLVDDMQKRQNEYMRKGIKTFHGTGNSLGSYLLFNCALRLPVSAIVFNGAGSVADVIFYAKRGPLKKVATKYLEAQYTLAKLREHWVKLDLPTLAKKIMSERMLVIWSLNDGVIPRQSAEKFVKNLKASRGIVKTKTNTQPHVISTFLNSLKVKELYNFLNG